MTAIPDQRSANFQSELDSKGYTLLPNVVCETEINNLISVVERMRQREKTGSAGVRHILKRSCLVRKFANSKQILGIAQRILGTNAKPTKAILFDKTAETNWYVTWHQDLTIAVKEKIEIEGFGPWSVKDGVHHVQPTRRELENIVALRVHLDDCSEENGAIKFIDGTHKIGILSPNEIAQYRDDKVHVSCPAERGDVIVMRQLVLHSSSQSTKVSHRRVLHIEFTGSQLPGGLLWAESSGLDSVELVMGIEEEFGLEIQDHEAENLVSVGITFEYLKTRLAKETGEDCISQKFFYKLRKALIQNFGTERKSITPDTYVTDLVSKKELEEGWPFLQLFSELEFPPYETKQSFFWLLKQHDKPRTIRDIVMGMIDLNRYKIDLSKSTDAQIWTRLITVIESQLNVNRDEVTYETRYGQDLGVC